MNNTLGAVLVFVSIFTASLALGDDKEANRSDLSRWKGESDSIWSYDITMDVIGYALSDTKLTRWIGTVSGSDSHRASGEWIF